MTSVMIATPSYARTVCVDYVYGLVETLMELERRGIPAVWLPRVGDSLLPACRNILASEFMASNASHLLMVDSDMCFSAAAVLRLLEHDLDPVAALYRAKDPVERYDFGGLQGAEVDPVTGLLEVDCVGTGFMLARRAVFECLEKVYPERRIVEAHGMYAEGLSPHISLHDYFPLGVVADGLYSAEDINFCRMFRAAGGRVWVDLTVQLGHLGAWTYVGVRPRRRVTSTRPRDVPPRA